MNTTLAQRTIGTVAGLGLALGTLAMSGLAAHAAPAVHRSAPAHSAPLGRIHIATLGGGTASGTSGGFHPRGFGRGDGTTSTGSFHVQGFCEKR